MNLQELRDHVYLFLGEKSGVGSFYTDAEVTTAINNAQRYIADVTGVLEQLATRNTVDGTDRYALPDDYIRGIIMFCEKGAGNRWVMRELSAAAMEEQRGIMGATKGQPQYYRIRVGAKQKTLYTTGDIIVSPTPDGVYTLRLSYVQAPDDLAVDGDIPMLPAQMHEAIALRAAMMLTRADDDVRRFRELRELFNESLSLVMRSAHLAGARTRQAGERSDIESSAGPARW